jgi:hypothetical protein
MPLSRGITRPAIQIKRRPPFRLDHSNESHSRELTASRPAELGQLQDHDHQNDNDQDADNDPNDSTVHFSSFRFAAEVILVTRSR